LLDFLTPIIADFLIGNPGIGVEVIVGNKPLNLARGDSDIAFRATTAPPKNLFARKVCNGRMGGLRSPDRLHWRLAHA